MLVYRIPFLLLLLLSIPSSVEGQIDTNSRRATQDTILGGMPHATVSPFTFDDEMWGYYLTSPVEFPIVENRDMNNALEAAGYPACKVPVATLGFGWQVQLSHFIGLVSYNRSTSRPATDTSSLAVSYRAISLGLGYDLLNHPYYALFPYVGFKFCKTKYRYDQKAADSSILGNYLQTNLDYKELSNSLAHIDLGLGADFQNGYLIGVRAGVLLPMGKAEWYINNRKAPISQSPGFRYQGYISITIGVGWGSSSKHDQLRELRRGANGGQRLN